MSGETQSDNQALVTEYALLIAENGVCELRMKARKRLGFLLIRLDDGNLDGVVGVARPCCSDRC
jgi:hypothetical protein